MSQCCLCKRNHPEVFGVAGQALRIIWFHRVPRRTNAVRLLTKAATEAINRLFRPSFKYSKAEVLLLDLCQPGEFTDDLFAHFQPVAANKVMSVLDDINTRWGRGTLRLASVPSSPAGQCAATL